MVNTIPGIKKTYHLLNGELINQLPGQCVLINVGRGSTLDDLALLDALKQGKIAGAVLVVFQQEPLPSDHLFWKTPNVLKPRAPRHTVFQNIWLIYSLSTTRTIRMVDY